MNQSRLLALISCLFGTLFFQFQSASAQDKDTGLKVLQPLTVENTSLAEMARRYPQFKHAPFEESGINPLILPFRDESIGDSPSSEDSLAFSFLVSWDMDYAPENFCSRHAYFIFKRSEKACRFLIHRYDPMLIKALMNRWNSSHAIGGSIRKTDGGYTGSVVVFDKNGATIATEKFDTPKPYHELLGDTSVAAMKILGCNPRQEIVDYLHQPRCKNPSSLTLLGKAAFAEEKTDEEFGLYQKILNQDPDFAEVRYWYGNQSWWNNRDPQEYKLELERTLDCRLIPNALNVYNINSRSNIEIKTKYYRWKDQAYSIFGEDSPTIIQMNLAQAAIAGKPDFLLMKDAIDVAGKYPNNGDLTDDTATAAAYAVGGYNKSMAASIQLAKTQSRYIPAIGQTRAINAAARAMNEIGNTADALATIQNTDVDDYDYTSDAPMAILTQAGRFQDVIKFYQDNRKRKITTSNITHHIALCAAIVGDIDTLRDVLARYQNFFASDKTLTVFQEYLRELEHPDQPMTFDTRKIQRVSIERLSDILLLYVNRDMEARGGRQLGKVATQMTLWNPNSRLAWVLEDQYMRQNPSPARTFFYDTLEFLHDDDPWVKQAVARWRALKLPTVENKWDKHPFLRDDGRFNQITQKNAEEFTLTVNCWAVGAKIRSLLDDGQRNQALSLAARYLDAAMRTNCYTVMTYARRLKEKAEQYPVIPVKNP